MTHPFHTLEIPAEINYITVSSSHTIMSINAEGGRSIAS